MRSEILPINTPALFDEAVGRASELLRSGQLVVLPTETVYGLAANAWNPAAVRRIYEVKARPPENPIIVHVAGIDLARRCVSNWPLEAEKLAVAFWPGPLTLVLPRSAEIPPIVTAGGSTVGVRWPSHPFMQAVIRECGFPLAAPSANRAGGLSPTTAGHARASLGDGAPLIVDGGPSQVGIESSVLDLSSSPPRLLRPGMIHAESLAAILGDGRLNVGAGPSGPLRSPGLLPKHYSPKTPLVVLGWTDDADLAARVAGFHAPSRKIHVVAHTRIPRGDQFGRVAVIPREPSAYARAIYAELHQCDEAGAELIVVESPPEGEEWRGIADRLERAARHDLPARR
jgi:L-threonylcarbamoyladenylate synthase